MNNVYRSILIASVMMLSTWNVLAQKKQIEQFQVLINEAVKKAYPASVRMWGFDVQQNQRTSAQFSGVVVSADGYILTAAHTTVPGKNYKVFFPDGRECIALALGRIDNPTTPGMPDVGMMKILDKGSWPYAEMGYSGSLVENEPCISISYPESLNQALPTLRLGQIAEVKNTYGFIRSTCKMEPGDSGGPLFDYYGRVIGLHSAIDVAEDQNFEIPVDLYRKYWTALQKEKTYTAFPEQQDSWKQDPLFATIQKDNKQKRLHPFFEKLHKNSSSLLLQSTVKGKIQQVEGTLFNHNIAGVKRQFLVSKNTLLGENPGLVSDKQNQLMVLARDKSSDLVLLALKQPIKGGIDFQGITTDSSVITMGKFIYTLNPNGTATQSVLSSVLFSLPKIASQAYLGAMVMFNSQPAQFSLIKPNTPASNAGIKVGDELLSINGKTISKASEFAPALMKLWPDDELTLSWKNTSGIFTKTFTLDGLTPAASNHPADKFEGGKSARRDGFASVFAHDAAIKANECGSPVFDQQGNFLGINIARFSRTCTLVMPATVVKKFIERSL
ncbi:trypsin-like peptidase domain-containing protein [Pedobacter rhizosphaerae]|uniref:Serine protease Do n=1 Tax=Pedobacter rhizosphaerae TaxID=390241 RepID=A0A1H9UVK4_9SPHI|nr:trypsin-like peptidase domain-containing protein [Pedobacter rhizosphaerae]SES13369.1 serine protease Do [Pedobacter rhizosphaerae]